jgi:ASC-1-like (ASCH) protein
MEHLAIMNRSLKLLDKIIDGTKIVESRWYMTKRDPWDNIHDGDVIYFKDGGRPVTVKAKIRKVLQFELTPDKVSEIAKKYGSELGLGNLEEFIQANRNKKYCILAFLKDVKQLEPFNIDKTGYGHMNAWICVDDINQLKSYVYL